MSAKKFDDVNRTRISVICSKQQHDLLAKAAGESDTDLSSWMLAHGLMAATTKPGIGDDHVVIVGNLAEKIVASAKKQGIKPDQLIRQLLITAGG